MLAVYKASAGSGKTFQLVVEYLKLLLKNTNNYKHILAVTFTNKATNEMKNRILEQLYLLSSNQKTDYLESLKKDNSLSEEFIRDRAKQVLKNILHDYNRFSISTIDSFTQKVIRAFNRELGISPNYTVELDSNIILDEAVDRMLLRIGEDKNLLKWLKEFSKEKIEETKSQQIDDSIKTLGKELFKESFQVFFPEDGQSVYSRNNLQEFGKELKDIIRFFENNLKILGKEAVLSMENNQLTIDDFSGKARGGLGNFFVKLTKGQYPIISNKVKESAENIEKWYTKTHKNKEHIHHIVELYLQPQLLKIISFFDTNSENYNTALAILKQLRTLGILTDLKEEIKTLLHEKGVLQLSDSNLLLSKIIGQSDSPFIYEKIGSFYKHFMLDEFQDTSGLQWFNFKPLLQNSLSEGNANLIVGDTKQSIYRWRNSDWKILAEQLKVDFRPEQRKEFELKENWRSDKNIIEFNNCIFKELKELYKIYLFNTIEYDIEIYKQKFDKVYESIHQEAGNTKIKNSGFVSVNFIPKDNFQQSSSEMLVEQVKCLQKDGIRASETAILIRTKKEGALIIQQFLEAAKKPENAQFNLSVLSNELLYLLSSKGVQFVVGVIENLVNPENNINKVTVLQLWENWLKPELLKGETFEPGNYPTSPNPNKNQSWQINDNYEEIFENELLSKIAAAKNKVIQTSLDETITHICSLFGLFNLETELPFLQTLIDKTGELKTSLSNDLSNFLFWWNENGYKVSVNVNEEVNAIRLLTIHKSKGLEFKAVLLPFVNWKTSLGGNFLPIIWCIAKSEPFNRFPLLPVRMGNEMKSSEFKQQYCDEKVNNFIDTLNLIYVAFTRAKSILIMNCEMPGENKNPDSGKPVNFLLLKALENIALDKKFENCWNSDKTIFQFGKIPQSATASAESNSLFIKKYQFSDFSEKIKLRMSGENFLVEGEKHKSVKNTGKIIHEILSEIEKQEDLEKACLNALKNGIINKTELIDIQQKIKINLSHSEVKNWFDGSYNVLNERDLLTRDKILRPDRIMISGNKAVVVDYKTGEKKSDSYYSQIKRYAKTLKESGIKNVEGYLWYISLNDVEKVCEY